MAKLNTCQLAGEQVKKPCKKCSDVGVPRKQKAPAGSNGANKENRQTHKRSWAATTQARATPKSIEIIGDTDEGEDRDEDDQGLPLGWRL